MTNLLAKRSTQDCCLFDVRAGDIMLKEAPIKKGDNIEFNILFEAATPEEIKKALGNDAPDGYLAGWASTSGRDLYNHEVRPGAFQESIDARGLSGPRGIKLLLDHCWEKPAGVIKVLEYRRGKLWMEAQLDLEVGYVKDRWHLLKMMGGANFSVGFSLQDYEVVTKTSEGDEDVYLRIDRGDLFEVSVVMFPGNEEAQMTFVKSRRNEDNPDEDELFFATAKRPAWRVACSRNLPVAVVDTFDVHAVKERLFKAAKIDTDKPDLEFLKKAFLSVDAANPQLRSAYKLPIADIVDGKLQVTTGGLDFAKSMVTDSKIPDDVKASARGLLDYYELQSEEAIVQSGKAPTSLADFEKALVAKGLVSGRNAARQVALVAKTCPQLFAKQTEVVIPQETALDAGKVMEMLSLTQKMKALFAPAAQ